MVEAQSDNLLPDGQEDQLQEEINPALRQEAMEEFRAEQSFTAAVIAGFVAAIVGAVIWAFISAAANYQIGYMAIALGFLVGLSMRMVGKGVDKSFSVAGGFFAFLGCILGNFFMLCYFASVDLDVEFFDVLMDASQQFIPIVKSQLQASEPVDFLFYILAIYEGYHLARRRITEEELQASIASDHRGEENATPASHRSGEDSA